MSPCVFADVALSEIMYDLSGSDTGREWVEIVNTGGASVEIATSTWKFFEDGTNHGLNLFQGSTILPPGGFAVIVDNPQKFLLDWPAFSGTIFDSVFSLGNTGETIALKMGTTTVSDQVSYTSGQGGAGDGNSLQKVSGVWQGTLPTPGADFSQPVSQATSTPDVPPPGTASSSPEVADVNSESSGSTYWPVEPQVLSRIIAPSFAISGADIVLKGEALGLEKRPLTNSRFLWNFGDGVTKEGENVLHAYNFPGDYMVILDVSSGKFSGSSRLKIHVVAADIAIAGVLGGINGKIELVNNSNQELDLSWWRIESGGRFFTLPKNTKLLPRGRLPLAASVLGFSVNEGNLSLLYPNGSLAYRFTNSSEAMSVPKTVVAKKPVVFETEVPVVVEAQPKKEEVVAKVPTTPAPATSSQVAAVGATLELSSAPVPSGPEARRTSSLWLYGLGGVIILGLSLALIPKKSGIAEGGSAEEYEIVE